MMLFKIKKHFHAIMAKYFMKLKFCIFYVPVSKQYNGQFYFENTQGNHRKT